VLNRWFDKKHDSGSSAMGPGVSGPRVPRHSGGWAALRKRLEAEPGLRAIDTGVTSPTNINYLTSLGHSIFLADLVHDACTGNWQAGKDKDDNPIWNVRGFLDHALNFAGRNFDDPREHIDAPTVFPDFARLVGKWEGRKPGDEIGERAVTLKYRLRVIERVDRLARGRCARGGGGHVRNMAEGTARGDGREGGGKACRGR